MLLSATITNISRCSLHDGPGIRTVVYFKGCPLRCRWCHNPETLSPRPQLLYLPTKCICCGECIKVCPEHHTVSDGKMKLLRDGCSACGRCAEVCPTGALTLAGEQKSVSEIMDEIKKDAHYYKSSGGGVTFSGGECLLHPEFVFELAKTCREEGIHTAVETALFVPWENVERVLPYVDLFFADLKIADSEKHKKFTGQPNELIIENLKKLSQSAKELIVRIPVIPSVNDSDGDIAEFAGILKTLGSSLKYVELLKYNNLAKSKYDIAGMTYESFADEPQTDERMKSLAASLAEASGIKCIC